jgi:hypothetical protein
VSPRLAGFMCRAIGADSRLASARSPWGLGHYDAPFINSVNSVGVKIRPLSPIMVTPSIP